MLVLARFFEDRKISRESIIDFIKWLGENQIEIDSQADYRMIELAYETSCSDI